jgi:hypothetical protein
MKSDEPCCTGNQNTQWKTSSVSRPLQARQEYKALASAYNARFAACRALISKDTRLTKNLTENQIIEARQISDWTLWCASPAGLLQSPIRC